MELVCKYFQDLSVGQLYRILQVRCQVFVVEQRNHYLDIDGIDCTSIHLFLEDKEKILAYARVFVDGDGTSRIGRVLSVIRGKGYGATIMNAAINECYNRFGKGPIVLESQCSVSAFYARHGFKIISDVFFENGIPHVMMRRGYLNND